MSELQPNFQRFKQATQPDPRRALRLGSLIDRNRTAATGLVLRQLSRSGEFVRTITCQPSQISVLDAEDRESLRPFQETLSGRDGAEIVSLRYGTRELFGSEVYCLGSEPLGWEKLSLTDALMSAGAPERLVQPTLAFVGLDHYSGQSVLKLDECARRRLAVCFSLFSHCPVLYLDRPFDGMTSAWVERIAALLCENARSSNKIFVVTGLDRLPAAWRASDAVTVEWVGLWRKRGMSLRWESDPLLKESIQKARLMMGAARPQADLTRRECFVTRAQSIHRPSLKASLPTAVQTEAIENPSVEDVLGAESAVPSIAVSGLFHRNSSVLPQAEEEGITRVRKKTGKLTRVSKIEKLFGATFAYRYYRRALAWCESRLPGAGAELTAAERARREHVVFRVTVEPMIFILGLYLIDLLVP